MKKLLLLITFLIPASAMYAQPNHVPNPGFEDTLGCPNSLSQVTQKCAAWRLVGSGSPDYFNECAAGSNVGVPDNFHGHQSAARGKAYCGIQPYNLNDHMEYISAHITPLVPGLTYEVSISVNLANNSSRATNNIGVFFNDTGYGQWWIGMLPVQPHVSYGSYGKITDTANWVRLTGYFLADSAYDNIIIGPFDDSTHPLEIDTVGGPFAPIFAYYYVDSVVVKLKPSGGIATPSIEELQLYPNPNNGSFALKGNMGTDKPLNVTIVNTVGQLVYNEEIRPLQGALSKEIQLDGMEAGLYLLAVSDDAGNVRRIRFRIE